MKVIAFILKSESAWFAGKQKVRILTSMETMANLADVSSLLDKQISKQAHNAETTSIQR